MKRIDAPFYCAKFSIIRVENGKDVNNKMGVCIES